MQPLPTEAGPLSHCSRCGKRVQSGAGKPTFVYGVGAVGHQSCAACGAKWRYLWNEQESAVKRSRRPLAIVGGLLLIGVLGVVAVVALRGSAKQYGVTAPTAPSTTRPPVTEPTGAVDRASAADFGRIYSSANGAKTRFMQWVLNDARATPQFDVNQRVVAYVRDARESQAALTNRDWPAAVAGDVKKLTEYYGAFLDDADLIRFGSLYSPSSVQRLKADSQAVKDAAKVVLHDLGVAPAS